MKSNLIFLAVLLLPCLSASAQNIRQDSIAFSRSGFPAPGALIAVCSQPATQGATNLLPCSPLAALCASLSDVTCTSPNPVTADGLGNYHYYLKPGTYAIQVYGPGLTTQLLRDQIYGVAVAATKTLVNCTAAGTTVNLGVDISSQVVMAVTSACGTTAAINSTQLTGICQSGCGNSGSAQIAYQGYQSTVFDNQSVIGDVVVPSATVGGEFHDAGASASSGKTVGLVTSLNSGAGTATTIDMFVGDNAALADPGSNGLVVRSALNTSRIATSADVIGLWSGTCNSATLFFGDGTCRGSIQVASNFTTANNTNLQTITGLVFNVPGGQNYSFHCALSYSQATANVAVAFGIQSATTSPTNIFANGTEQITVGPPATFVTGILPTLTTTTATSIVSGTPGATATNYTAQLDGTIELPSGADAINIMVSTAAGADAVTVLRGSYCQLF